LKIIFTQGYLREFIKINNFLKGLFIFQWDLKNVTESTAGIIPGDRGKVGGSWCRPPLQTALAE
jgi:hypothetical protein